ncbi:hypothetical protein DRO59_07615 [Candidatus Bathyarchaeota archaeon]|nr:MAG: hypothetical protein DRO59_07615 [Candidatus Bathyarchaeota archaeon]
MTETLTNRLDPHPPTFLWLKICFVRVWVMGNDALNTFYQDYSELQANYTALLQEHEQNIRSLIYITIATATIFIVAAAYMSIHAHKKLR